MTLDQLDSLAASMERKWGVDRLPRLVPPAWRAKFETLQAQLDAASSFGGDATAAIAALAKAWRLMDAEATAAGHEPMAPAFAEAEWAPGRLFAVAHDDAHRQTLVARNKHEGRDVSVFTVADLARLVASIPDVARIYELFPGAYIAAQPATFRPGKRKADLPQDEIPFGGDEEGEAA